MNSQPTPLMEGSDPLVRGQRYDVTYEDTGVDRCFSARNLKYLHFDAETQKVWFKCAEQGRSYYVDNARLVLVEQTGSRRTSGKKGQT